MKRYLSIIIFLCCIGSNAQDLSFSRKGSDSYTEMDNPAKADPAAWSMVSREVNVSFASDNQRYPQEKVPEIIQSDKWDVTAWKGERIHNQILIWTRVNIPVVRFSISDMKSPDGHRISRNNIKASFVRYVMSDGFFEGCSQRHPEQHDSSLVADPIDITREMPVAANTVRPVWLTITVPGETTAGNYYGSLIVKTGSELHELKINLLVKNHLLPPPADWKYDLDLWQYPAPVARIHDVDLWSKKHFELMKSYLKTLADAGQKVITANIIEQPWGLDHVHFDDATLIKWIKHDDGTWTYDYSIFDRYITLAMSCGITGRINCYTMITWDLNFIYFDEASGKNKTVQLKPGSEEYNDFWSSMIKDFTSHLKKQGWFEKTAIAMDERPVESMKAVIDLLKKVDPAWKIALAGDTYHPEIENDIYDYSLASYLDFDDTVLKNRRKLGKPTTYYTACPENHPNGYTFSPPAENAWLGLHASAKGYSGYLWWAYNTWVADPLRDTRWIHYPAGSLFQFYPGPRTSIRFEKLVEGIQYYEKIRILKEQFAREGNKVSLQEIDNMLSQFEIGRLDSIPAYLMVENAKSFLNKY